MTIRLVNFARSRHHKVTRQENIRAAMRTYVMRLTVPTR
jgi:hypothetical protein